MSFFDRETSRDSARPIEIYEIVSGLRSWYYTSNRKPVIYKTKVYLPVTMKRSKLSQSKEYAKSSISLTAAGDLPAAADFMRNPPEGIVTLTIYRGHEGDEEWATYWTGRVVDARYSAGETSIKADPIYTSLQGQGRRKTYSTQCNWTLYRIGCNVNDQAWKTTGTVTAIDGLNIAGAVFGARPNGFFIGGKILVWVDGDPYNRRIDDHSETVVRLNTPIPGLQVGTVVEAFPGCDHTLDMCRDRFQNWLNYGGFPWKPLKDPFSGSSAF